jgi:hypothetical protein
MRVPLLRAALVTHGFVALRQEDMLADSIERLDQPRPVDEVERRALGVSLGDVGEAARGHEKAPLCIGGDHGVMQAGKIARCGWGEVGGSGASGDEFPPGLCRHKLGRFRVADDCMLETFQYQRHGRPESRGR